MTQDEALMAQSLKETTGSGGGGSETQNLGEAPASASVKIKSAQGFEYIFTLRDQHAANLMYKIDAMEKKWISLGWEPVAQNGYQKASVTPQNAPQQAKIQLTCKVCGSVAEEKQGVSKNGKAYHGIFCSSGNREHTQWLP